MTTNYKEALDEAIIRPGRIDYKIEFGNCTIPQIKKICKKSSEKFEEKEGESPNGDSP